MPDSLNGNMIEYYYLPDIKKGDKEPVIPYLELPKDHKYFHLLLYVCFGNIIEADKLLYERTGFKATSKNIQSVTTP